MKSQFADRSNSSNFRKHSLEKSSLATFKLLPKLTLEESSKLNMASLKRSTVRTDDSSLCSQ